MLTLNDDLVNNKECLIPLKNLSEMTPQILMV